MREIPARNARAEAETRLGGHYEVRVLEPSPPVVDDPPFFADDPAVPGPIRAEGVSASPTTGNVGKGTPPQASGPGGSEHAGGTPAAGDATSVGARTVVTPTTAGDVTWDALAAEDPDLQAWCAERWLGGWERLAPVPPGYADSTAALRRLAVYVLAPARKAANTKIGLRYTIGGFGTPFYGNDEQVRVDEGELVRQVGDQAWSLPIGSLMEAAEFAGVKLTDNPGVGHDLPELGAIGKPLPVRRPRARRRGPGSASARRSSNSCATNCRPPGGWCRGSSCGPNTST